MHLVLGGGISGISAAYHLGKKQKSALVVEKRPHWGGLCAGFLVGDFRFDRAIHLSFSKSDYVKDLFRQSSDFVTHQDVSPYNYVDGQWTRHPLQNNLYPLSTEEKVQIVSSFCRRDQDQAVENYEDWLRSRYGDFFAEKYPMRYTRKYWTVDARELSTSWIKDRMSQPDLDTVLLGAFSPDSPNAFYAPEMRYPVSGGYQSFIQAMASQVEFELGAEVGEIRPQQKIVTLRSGKSFSYEKLVSSLPLPEIVKLIPEIPAEVRRAGENLLFTSVGLVSVGLKRKVPTKALWFYLYDEETLPSRCYSPDLKSPGNAPEGKSSFQFEIYFSNRRALNLSEDEIINNTLRYSHKMGLFSQEDIEVCDYRVLPYGNVVFYNGMEKDRQIVLDYLDSLEISSVGRFGEWDYFWSDQSLLSGKRAADEITAS